MRTRRLGPMLLGLAAVISGALVILVYYYQKAGGRLPFAAERYSFKIQVDEPQQLLKHADVRAAGVKVGEVNEIENKITANGVLAIVEIAIDEKKLEPVYKDSAFLVRQKTLVGENYIEVRQGTPRSGPVPEGATLAPRQNQEIVPLDRLLGMLNTSTRKRVSANFRDFGEGFEGRAPEFNQTLQALQPLFNDGGRTIALLNDNKESVAEAIRATGIVTSAVAARGDDAQTLVRAVRRTAQVVARRDEELKTFFAEFPSTLRQARSSVTKLSGFSGRATPVISDVREGLVALRPTLRQLGPTATSARTLFNELEPMLKVAAPAVAQLTPFSNAGVGAIPSFDALMRQTNPFFAFLKPYDKDIGSLLANFSAGLTDKTFFGNSARCSCAANYDALTGFLPGEAFKEAADVLLESGIVQKAIKVGIDPIRKPGTLPDQSNNFQGAYPRVQAADK